MNQSIFQKLKRVRLFDLFHVLFCLVAIPFALVYRQFHRDLWLFCDSPSEARDNGYWLFRYVREQHSEQDAVFAIDTSSPDFSKVCQCGNTVRFGSFKHWILYLSASNVISSQKASGPNAAVCYVLERFGIYKGNKIFLQHGIIKDDIPFLYYSYTKIRLFTCSTMKEYNYVKKQYGYPEGHIQLLGLCRFDELLKGSANEKIVLIMPTWRKWLSHPTKGVSAGQLEQEFLSSDYFHYWNSLLRNLEFHKILEESDWNAVFYLHREAQKYSSHFHSIHPRIRIGTFLLDDVQELLKKSSVLITDYSSVAMDFAILDKPLLYYQFDYEAFRKGHLKEGYFNYQDDGFGPVCISENRLLSEVRNLINGGTEAVEYALRREEFFTLKDCNNCCRTYEAIKRL